MFLFQDPKSLVDLTNQKLVKSAFPFAHPIRSHPCQSQSGQQQQESFTIDDWTPYIQHIDEYEDL